jgi:multiple sugar transport system ATP-binding protein
VRIAGLYEKLSGRVTLGFRAEDVTVSPDESGAVSAPVYSIELLGDSTLVTVRSGATLLAGKAGKGFRKKIGSPVSFALAAGQCHLFDASTGERMSGGG